MGLARTFEAAAGPAQKPARDALSALLSLGRPLVMGILNVTPDSFSDGGRFIDPAKAVAHAGIISQQGADILDIGAESTRPYGDATPVSAEDEMARLSPVLPAVLKFGLPVSIDTIKASVASWALDQGAVIVNDVWGLQRDPAMAKLVAERGVPVIVMHNREAADPDIVIIAEVTAFFARSLEIAERAGISRRSPTARRSCARMTSPRPCRRYASLPPSAAPKKANNERPHFHQRAVAARLSRRDGL